MHCADFILIVRNMFERHKAVTTSYLLAKAQVDEISNADLFAEMSSEDLQNAARRQQFNLPGERTTGETFLQSMNAKAKGMAHTSGAAERARSEMFSYCTRFSLSALFHCITRRQWQLKASSDEVG